MTNGVHRGRRRWWAAAGLAVLAAVFHPGAAAARQVDTRDEARLLREAAALEWRGRIDEAREVLTGLLSGHPTSSGALFALERILRNQGRVADVLPWADRYLAADPAASGVRYMKLRVLIEADSLGALDREARAWFRAEPGSPDPYREVARLFRRVRGPEAALQVLRQGREALDAPGGLAMEMGDLLADMGSEEAAVEEWSRALRSPQVDLTGILRRLDGLQGNPAVLAPPLLSALTAPPSSPERQEMAVRVALRLGLAEDALRLARTASADRSGGELRAFLEEVARRADEAGVPEVAVWALGRERGMVPARERPALDMRIASLALQAGDTALAVEARSRLARALPAGSLERREVMAELIRVEAFSASLETLTVRLGTFKQEFPDAPELDELGARVAAGLAGRGQVGAARELLDGVDGPLSTLERGYLHFTAGEVEEGRDALSAAVPALAPTRATQVLHLVAYLDRLSPDAARTLARAAARAHHGHPLDGADGLVASLPRVPDEERPPLMAWAGELATAGGDSQRAEELLATLVDAYPEAREYPDAALALARLRMERGDPEAAREVLERLILEWPGSPVVPAARRELQRIRSGLDRSPEARR